MKKPPRDTKAVDPVVEPDDATAAGVVHVPIDGVLDLHSFHPRDLRTLIPDYLAACHERGITAVRLIHGRGTGAVRDSVHALLRRNPLVLHFRLAPHDAGGAGATLVDLVPHDP